MNVARRSLFLTSLPLWLRGLAVQGRVIHALMFREALKKHGHNNLGFFWIIAEPLFLIVGIMILWTIAHMSHNSEVDVIPFALTGYGFITLWRHISNSCVLIMSRNRLIVYHSHINLIDMILAKAALETLALLATFAICYVPLCLLGVCPVPHDPLLIICGFFFTGWFALGFGLVLSAVSEFSDVVHNVIGAVMYITMPLTGAFTMQEWLPEKARDFLAWSPLVNCIEMLRGGVFPESVAVHWSFSYVALSCIVTSILGLPLCRFAQRFVDH